MTFDEFFEAFVFPEGYAESQSSARSSMANRGNGVKQQRAYKWASRFAAAVLVASVSVACSSGGSDDEDATDGADSSTSENDTTDTTAVKSDVAEIVEAFLGGTYTLTPEELQCAEDQHASAMVPKSPWLEDPQQLAMVGDLLSIDYGRGEQPCVERANLSAAWVARALEMMSAEAAEIGGDDIFAGLTEQQKACLADRWVSENDPTDSQMVFGRYALDCGFVPSP